MPMKVLIVLLMLLCFALPPDSSAADAPKSNEQLVRAYVAAYNERKIETMLSMAADDIQWLNVAGDKITVETKGKEQLRASLTAYFKSTPGARSELEWVQAGGSRVCAMEKAFWRGKSGEKSQRSLSVYEFRDGLIARVYYYPAEK